MILSISVAQVFMRTCAVSSLSPSLDNANMVLMESHREYSIRRLKKVKLSIELPQLTLKLQYFLLDVGIKKDPYLLRNILFILRIHTPNK
jgi:hypothetical protein